MPMSKLRLFTFVFALSVAPALVLAPVAHGQGGDSGSITGYVFDQAGNPLRGIQITATSPTQIGGTKTAYSDEEGAFRMRALIPGTFEVKATAPKMRPIIQSNVKVGITAPVELNFVMEVKTAEEQVTVIERAPMVSTSKPNVSQQFDSEFIEALPHAGRDNIHRDMLGSVAGSVSNRMRGGAANQTIITQDGFELGPPGKTISPSLKSSAAFEIQTAGYAGDNPGAPGGLMNLVTRSGSNKFEFEFNATVENDQLRFFRTEADPRSNTFYYVINPSVAGPIIRDKLWFFINTETHFTQDGRQPDAEGFFPEPLPAQRIIQKGSNKLTWQITSRNKLSFINNYELPFEHNRIGNLGTDPDAQEDRTTRRLFYGLIWESLLRDDLILRSQVGYTHIPEHIFPSRCRTQPEVDCDSVPSITVTEPRAQRQDNNNNHSRTDVYGLQFVNQIDILPPWKLLGEHNIQLKDRFYTEKDERKQSRPGDMMTEYRGERMLVPLARTTYYSNDPRYEDERFGWWIGTSTLSKNVATLADVWKPTRHLTVTPSISYIWARGGNSSGDDVINHTTWVPGAALVWDATHDGRTAIRASASSYVDLDIGAIARHNLGGQVARRCEYNTTSGLFENNCVFSGGTSRNTIGSPCGPSGIDVTGTPCITKLKVPRTLELTAGGQREILTGLALSLDLVHRKFDNQYEVNETNRIWLESGNGLATFGGYKNGRNETVMDLGTPDGAERTYNGVTFGLNKREGRLKIQASYTLAYLSGTVANGSSNDWGDVPSRDVFLDGYLPDDHRHEIKLSTIYAITPWLTVGSRTTYLSGFPYDQLYRQDVTATFDRRNSRRGETAGANINDPGDDRTLRLPDRMEVNGSIHFNMQPIIRQNLDFYVDVLNVLALRTVTAYGTSVGQDFGVARGWMDPFRIRLGVNYKF
jgi:hypothetical protein